MSSKSRFPVVDNALKALRQLSAPQYDGMTTWSLLPLGLETTSAAQLLRHFHHLLVAGRPVDDYYEVYLALMSAGMERTLKVALGYASLSRKSGWATDLEGRGHKIADMNRSLLRIADKSEHSNEATVGAVVSLREDVILNAMLELAQRYASGGRYHYLDELAKRKELSPGEGALGAWVSLVGIVEQNHPEIDALRDDAEMDLAHKLLAASLRNWLSGLSAFARAGVLSRRAVSFAERIEPRNLFSSDLNMDGDPSSTLPD